MISMIIVTIALYYSDFPQTPLNNSSLHKVNDSLVQWYGCEHFNWADIDPPANQPPCIFKDEIHIAKLLKFIKVNF